MSITESTLATAFETGTCGTCSQGIAHCFCKESECHGWRHLGAITAAHGSFHVAAPAMENPQKCPGCPLELDADDVPAQIHHMRTRHPEIIEQRLTGIVRRIAAERGEG